MRTKDIHVGLEVGYSGNGKIDDAKRAFVVVIQTRCEAENRGIYDTHGVELRNNAANASHTVGLAVNARLDEWYQVWGRPKNLIDVWSEVDRVQKINRIEEQAELVRRIDARGANAALRYRLHQIFETSIYNIDVKGVSVQINKEALLGLLDDAGYDTKPLPNEAIVKRGDSIYRVQYSVTRDADSMNLPGICIDWIAYAPSQDVETNDRFEEFTNGIDKILKVDSLIIGNTTYKVENEKPFEEYLV